MTRAALYARVSSDDRNKTGGENLRDQLRLCRDHAGQRGYQIIAELAEDDRGASGASFDLPQLSQALELARSGQYEVLVVRELDRLSRRLGKQLAVEEELKRAGVAIEYVLYDFPDTPEGRLNKNMRAMLAEYEREKINQRMSRGRNRLARNGKLILHGRAAPYGYRRGSAEGPTTLEIDEAQAMTVRDIFAWYTEGDGIQGPMGTPTIAIRLTEAGILPWADLHGMRHMRKSRPRGVWCPSSVSKILANELYTGVWRYGANDIAVSVPAIIGVEQFEAAKRKAAANRWHARRNTKHDYLMQHRLTCPLCGHAIGVKRNDERNQHYYFCRIARNDATLNCENRRHYSAARLDATVWAWLRDLLTDSDALEAGLRRYQNEREAIIAPAQERMGLIDEMLSAIRAKRARILDLYADGDWDREELDQRRDQYDARLRALEVQRAEVMKQIQADGFDEDRLVSILEFARTIAAGIEAADVDFERRRELVDLLDVTGTVCHEDGGDWVTVQCILGGERLAIANPSSSSSARQVTPQDRRRKGSAPWTRSS